MRTPNKVHRVFAFLSFLFPFITYYLTTSGSISFGRSGLLAVAAWNQEYIHAAGSPLWVIVAGAFSHVIPGDPAHALAILSAFLTAIASAFVYLGTSTLLGAFRSQSENIQ